MYKATSPEFYAIVENHTTLFIHVTLMNTGVQTGGQMVTVIMKALN